MMLFSSGADPAREGPGAPGVAPPALAGPTI